MKTWHIIKKYMFAQNPHKSYNYRNKQVGMLHLFREA